MSRRNRKSGKGTGAKNALPIVGKTKSGKIVMTGVYEFHETYGMPLDFLFSYMKDNDAVPDFVDLYQWAKKNGMKHNKILHKIYDPIVDAWGSQFANIVIQNLDNLNQQKKL